MLELPLEELPLDPELEEPLLEPLLEPVLLGVEGVLLDSLGDAMIGVGDPSVTIISNAPNEFPALFAVAFK